MPLAYIGLADIFLLLVPYFFLLVLFLMYLCMLRNKWELVLRFCGHLFVKADPFWVAQTFAPQTGSQHLNTP